MSVLTELANFTSTNLNLVVGDPMFIGILLFICFVTFIVLSRMFFIASLVIAIPSLFLIFSYIPALKPVFGIGLGILLFISISYLK